MAKKTKKASLLYIALGAVVGLGAVMGISRLFSQADRSELGTDLKDYETNVAGYEIMLAYDDAEKILEICRSAMEDSDLRAVEPGYTYAAVSDYVYYSEEELAVTMDSISIALVYDYSEAPEEDALWVYECLNGFASKMLFKVDQSGISGEGYIFGSDNTGMGLVQNNVTSYKLEYGGREYLNEEISEEYFGNTFLVPDEIINLVRLVAPAD